MGPDEELDLTRKEAERLQGLIVLMRIASYAKQNEHLRESFETGARKLETMLQKWEGNDGNV